MTNKHILAPSGGYFKSTNHLVSFNLAPFRFITILFTWLISFITWSFITWRLSVTTSQRRCM